MTVFLLSALAIIFICEQVKNYTVMEDASYGVGEYPSAAKTVSLSSFIAMIFIIHSFYVQLTYPEIETAQVNQTAEVATDNPSIVINSHITKE